MSRNRNPEETEETGTYIPLPFVHVLNRKST